jgi:hypothetical protein
MPEPKSFLATVKSEIDDAFASVYDDLAEICPADDILAGVLIRLKKDIWTIVEKRTKESFMNGRKATGGGADKVPKSERKPNPFRKD